MRNGRAMIYSPYIPSVVFLDPPVLPNPNLKDSEELREIEGCEAIRTTAQGHRQSWEVFVSTDGMLVKASPGDRKG